MRHNKWKHLVFVSCSVILFFCFCKEKKRNILKVDDDGWWWRWRRKRYVYKYCEEISPVSSRLVSSFFQLIFVVYSLLIQLIHNHHCLQLEVFNSHLLQFQFVSFVPFILFSDRIDNDILHAISYRLLLLFFSFRIFSFCLFYVFVMLLVLVLFLFFLLRIDAARV